jgi:hypothetical protein
MPTFSGFISEQNSGGLIIRDLALEPLVNMPFKAHVSTTNEIMKNGIC